jgi:hypothetical protein
MKKLIGFIFIIALIGGISCKPDVTVNPTIVVTDTVLVDPDILKFAKFMAADWRCTRTSFTTTNTDWIYSDSLDCKKEKQFAFLKEMKITNTKHYDIVEVENTYACSSDVETIYFHLEKIACCGFTITEKDDRNQVVRI